MHSLLHTLVTAALFTLVSAPLQAARAQVPARDDAYVWRGVELSWGRWSHRLGELSSFIAPDGEGLSVHGGVGAGAIPDPGGVELRTRYTRVEPAGDDGLRFWHLAGDEIVLSGVYDCGEEPANGTGTFVGEMVLGDEGRLGRPRAHFDPTRIDAQGPTPDALDHVDAVLNGLRVLPGEPNGAHTVDQIHIAVLEPPRYDPDRGTLSIPLVIEYRPGCVPHLLHTCSNPFEGPRGTEQWSVRVQPFFLVYAWDDGSASPRAARGALVDETPTRVCGDNHDVDLSVGIDDGSLRRAGQDDTSARAQVDSDATLLGFRSWGVYAGAPGPWYEEGTPIRSCQHCAVALTGRHLRSFGLALGRSDDDRATVVRGHWSSHPFDGNPYALTRSNPHWPEFSWALGGLALPGEAVDDTLVAGQQPAFSFEASRPLP